jgi:tryptophanase
VHQGRAAEKILFTVKGDQEKFVLSNTLFDTTRANIEFSGAVGVDLLTEDSKDPSVAAPFKGNMDTEGSRIYCTDGAENISLVILTVTNNSGGGQPVSMANVKAVKAICVAYKIPFFIDACHFAKNAYFIKQREAGYESHTILQIAQEMFSYADGCTISAKKDAFANIGGFLAVHDAKLAEPFVPKTKTISSFK